MPIVGLVRELDRYGGWSLAEIILLHTLFIHLDRLPDPEPEQSHTSWRHSRITGMMWPWLAGGPYAVLQRPLMS